MERRIVYFGDYFKEFVKSLDDDAREKIDYVLDMLKKLKKVNPKFVKHIRDGLFELRVTFEGNIYRVFFIFDKGNIVVLLTGFQKKSQKTPQKEIEKALRIKKNYVLVNFLAAPCSIWGLNSPARDRIHVSCIRSTES